MRCPTHSLQSSPSWKRLTEKQRKIKGVVDLCLREVSLMTELELVRSDISLLTE